MNSILRIVGRKRPLFDSDINELNNQLFDRVKASRFLVVGGAGTIGKAVVKEIFKRNPKVLHVVDISENNLVELVRDIRSSFGYIDGDFKTFAIDSCSLEFERMVSFYRGYDYILNLSALKHVRSEKDPFTLMRMINVNILNSIHLMNIARDLGSEKYFCISTDKAADPINLMGASKRIMELCLMRQNHGALVSMARFANVAFSDGSLLHGFNQRLLSRQPLSAPENISRYFITPEESGQLCLLSALFGHHGEIFIPKLEGNLELVRFSDIAKKFLEHHGFEPHICDSEEEARNKCESLIAVKKWPCYFFTSDTTGEKDFEEFSTADELIDHNKFSDIDVIECSHSYSNDRINSFLDEISAIKKNNNWNKGSIIEIFNKALPNFKHRDLNKFLDDRM